MIRWRFVATGVTLFLLLCCSRFSAAQPPARPGILDVTTDKARYAPGEKVLIHIALSGAGSTSRAVLRLSFRHLSAPAGADITKSVLLPSSQSRSIIIPWQPPVADFQGYFVDVRLTAPGGRQFDRSQTAVDVSSTWNRFPRYGYLAHYSSQEGADPAAWVAELNRFHIDGLEFYDFQNRHEQPLAGTVQAPASQWYDVGGRLIERRIVNEFLSQAHHRNMMTMAYNASYSAYEDAFSNGSPVQLQWATWPTPSGPRTLQTAKSLNLPDTGWKTRRLIFMNENSASWQNYLYEQMDTLFRVYPFDGWHIDTFGDDKAFAYDGSPVDFIAGFRPFIDRAKSALGKPIVLNTVGTLGEEQTALSQADFVYSELWDQNETYAGILSAADRVHRSNPNMGLVMAAYLHRLANRPSAPAGSRTFNMPSVLLADAAIFASGAAHIELGDGQRMLSSEYFPDDSTFAVTPQLSAALRPYYDFLTAYENILRDRVTPASFAVEIEGVKSSPDAKPDTVWCLGRQSNDRLILHLINLLGSSSDRWRDIDADRPDAPLLHDVRVRIYANQPILSAGWASPDDGGRYHTLDVHTGAANGRRYSEFTVPSLKYWDVLLLNTSNSSPKISIKPARP